MTSFTAESILQFEENVTKIATFKAINYTHKRTCDSVRATVCQFTTIGRIGGHFMTSGVEVLSKATIRQVSSQGRKCVTTDSRRAGVAANI